MIKYLAQKKTFKLTQENKSHIQNLIGAKAVMLTLLANIEQQNRIIRKSCMAFFDTFSLFLPYHEHESGRILVDHSRKKEIKEFIWHPKHGILMYILSNKFIAVRSYDVNYEELFEELLNTGETFSDDCNVAKETADQLSNSMDSAWEKKVVKYALTSTRNRTELENLGIVDRISRTVEEVAKGISERKKYFSTAVDES